MPQNDRPVNPPLKTCVPFPGKARSTEVKLDGLLQRYRQRVPASRSKTPIDPSDPLEELRERFRIELVPAFLEVVDKYGPQGIQLHLDVGRFLAGGSEILIDIAFESSGIRLLGTVLANRIAFQVTRYTNNVGPAISSGPTLQTRNLSGRRFRDFLCEHISDLVRSALRQARPIPAE
ncbi:MAG: hypothetical protein JSV19_08040 [Phycisphaerales bacterium]|nr:MAG: hypothetical protein JSV19_08040 [Phycisphaerales bacterium]